jgi:hypothetical protein
MVGFGATRLARSSGELRASCLVITGTRKRSSIVLIASGEIPASSKRAR